MAMFNRRDVFPKKILQQEFAKGEKNACDASDPSWGAAALI